MAPTASATLSKRRRTCTERRRRPAQQIELFGDERPGTLIDTPAWQDLPTATQTMVTSLMVRLILGHAETRPAGPVTAEASHDL
jgi:hypothetical protein